MNHLNCEQYLFRPPFVLAVAALMAAAPTSAPTGHRAYTALIAAPVYHGVFNRLLKKYVNGWGLNNYPGLKADQKEFDQYLELLSKNPPTASAGKADQPAYWLNAYTAYPIKPILKYYPLQEH